MIKRRLIIESSPGFYLEANVKWTVIIIYELFVTNNFVVDTHFSLPLKMHQKKDLFMFVIILYVYYVPNF